MRIIFLLPTVSWSGGIRVVGIYAKWLVDHGHEVLLISQAARTPTMRSRVSDLIKGKGWKKHIAHPTSYLDKLPIKHNVLPSGKVPTLSDVPPADVLISTWWETTEWSSELPANRGARVYFVQGHEIVDYAPRERCEATYRRPFHKIVIAKWLVDLMCDQYNDCRVDLVHNGVDHEQFNAPQRGRRVQPTLGFLYNEAFLKGMDVTLQVVGKLRVIYPNLKVIAFGTHNPSGKFIIPDCIELHVAPSQDKLKELYSSCDVWLTTSRSEGFNLMAMEALACRTPVVSTKTGWPIEGLQDGFNGYLINIDDVDAATMAVSKIFNLDEVGWINMSNNAWFSVSNSSWEISSQKFEKALINACDRAGNGEIFGHAG